MQYLCLIYDEPANDHFPPNREEDATASVNRDEPAALLPGEHPIVSSLPHVVHGAMTVRVRNGSMSVTDGSFAETMDHLGAFWIVDARDLNDALRLASKMPRAHTGCVEVRPIGGILPC